MHIEHPHKKAEANTERKFLNNVYPWKGGCSVMVFACWLYPLSLSLSFLCHCIFFVIVFSLSLSLSLASSFCWSVIVFACWLHPLIISKKRGGIILWKPILDQKWILSALIGLARCTAHELSAKPIDNCPDRLLHSTEPIDNCPRGTLHSAKPTIHNCIQLLHPPCIQPGAGFSQITSLKGHLNPAPIVARHSCWWVC